MPPQDQSQPPAPPAPAPLPQTEAPPPPPSVAPPPPQAAPVAPAVTPPKRGSKGILILLLLIVFLGGLAAVLIPRLMNTSATVTLTWWGLWEDQTIVAPLIAEYQKAHPNVTVNYVPQAKEDYRERLTSSLARGQGPDIFRIHNTWVPMFRNELDAMPSTVMSPSEYSTTFYPVVASDMAKGSSYAGIPLGFDTIALFINEEIFETFGKSPPATWDELRALAKELTIQDENGTIKQAGAALGRTENVDHWPEILALLMLQNRAKLTEPTGELAEAALDFYTRFSKTDHVWDNTLPSSTVAFAGGKVAMYFGPSWRIHEIKLMNPNLRFRVVNAPQLPKDTPQEPSVYYATYWSEGVWAESKGKTAAWDFLKFLSTRESLQKLYQNASATRAFGEPYPRVDMQDLLTQDPVVGAFVGQGKEAKSWYLASRTFDGPTGINSQIIKYFEDAVNKVVQGSPPQGPLQTVATGVVQVLSQYGLAKAPVQPQ